MRNYNGEVEQWLVHRSHAPKVVVRFDTSLYKKDKYTMSLQPKTRKYRYSFRNKTRTSSRLPSDICIRKLKSNNSFTLNINESRHLDRLTPTLNLTQRGESWSFVKPVAFFTNNVSQICITTKDYKPQDLGGPINYVTPSKNSSEAFLLQASRRFEENFFGNKPACFLGGTSSLKLKVDPKLLSVNKLLEIKKGLSLSQKASTFAHSSSALDKVKFGECGFYFCDWGTVSAKYIDTIRLTIARKLKKSGRFWIRICPDTPVTARSAETRMGRGKGAINYYEAKVQPGQMFMEFSGVPQEMIHQIYRELTKKTNIQIKYIA